MFVALAITTTKSINQKQSENSIEFELLFVSYRNNSSFTIVNNYLVESFASWEPFV